MKSINNKTEYDDILFWNIIIESFKKMFVLPMDNAIITKTNDSFCFDTKNPSQVKNIAKGTIIFKNDKIIEIEHENEIKSVYKLGKVNETLKENINLNQSANLGIAKHLELKILIPLNRIFGENNE